MSNIFVNINGSFNDSMKIWIFGEITRQLKQIVTYFDENLSQTSARIKAMTHTKP